MRTLNLTGKWLLLTIVAFGLTGCRTLQYREVQRDFRSAVQADNTGDPFGNGYENILTDLTPEYIEHLDPQLRPNAWMLRAVSAWRSGSFSNATESADRGLAAGKALESTMPFAGSRDEILLQMIPALVVDSEQSRRLVGSNAPLSEANYKPIERAYRSALAQLDDAALRFNANTPEDVHAYYYYQRWRSLQHWTAAINRITDGTVMVGALDRAKTALGKSLEDAMKESRDKIPASQPLRALIRAQGGQ